MKTPKRVKVVANLPAPGQDSITNLIGREFEVVLTHHDDTGKMDGTVSVDAGGNWGQIVLQRAEYEVVA